MKRSSAVAAGVFLAVSAVAAISEEAYKDAVLADKPFAYYRLDETSDKDAVADEMNENPGAFINEPEVGMRGAVLSEPKNGAVELKRAKNQYIKLTTLGKYGRSISSGFTVEFWLKTGNAKDHQNVFGTANSPDYVTDFLVDIGYEGSAGRLRIYCRDDHSNRFGADFYPRGRNINIYDDRWHHVVYVYEAGSKDVGKLVKLYVDGESQKISVWRKGDAPKLSAFNDPVTLGAMNLRGDISDSLEGCLDEVAFYESRLSGRQVAHHYQAAGYKQRERPVPGGVVIPLSLTN